MLGMHLVLVTLHMRFTISSEQDKQYWVTPNTLRSVDIPPSFKQERVWPCHEVCDLLRTNPKKLKGRSIVMDMIDVRSCHVPRPC